ncbi:Hypothetical protein R9X50_00773000 [Acrodontium crateriforme]|uniref:NADH-cytochrome b5 reductase 1 n=1 Tax=Acrodontium crateriforme TaxID=150365 RepID=A0AAQ3MC81_9PEZI|nr:Hypothetical protein R9X50_00773000 [Acrodontium crateriforme]
MSKIITREELGKHTTKKDLWIAIHGKVYDVTSYSEDHPGGVDSLVEVAGSDATEEFEDLGHTSDAREIMERFLVGELEKTGDYDSGYVKLQRNLPPVPAKDRHEESKHHLYFDLTHMAVMSSVMLAGFVFMREYDRIHLPKTATTTAILRLLPYAVTTSVASIALVRLFAAFKKAFPGRKAYPAHYKVVEEVARPSTHSHAVLDPRQYLELPVQSKEMLSHNTAKYTLSLPKKTDVLGLPIGQHIAVRAVIDGKAVNRSYTPTSSNKDRGRLELVIKHYDDGLLTGRHLKNVKPGDKLQISGPRGHMRYRKGMCDNIGMLAGGTGITPMYQIIRAICENPKDNTKISLIYANQTEGDILLRKELNTFARTNSHQFKVHYVLGEPPKDWKYGVGRATPELVKEKFAAADANTKAMLCGPPGMVNAAKEWLVNLGFEKPRAVSKMEDQVFLF